MKESQGVKMRSKLKENYIHVHVVIVIATLDTVSGCCICVHVRYVCKADVYTHYQLCF